jgi:hypothetical protein
MMINDRVSDSKKFFRIEGGFWAVNVQIKLILRNVFSDHTKNQLTNFIQTRLG